MNTKCLSLVTTYMVTLVIYFSLSMSNTVSATERVVASGGSVTEIIYALGKQDLLVGVDSTSTYPDEAKSLPQIGYVRRVSSEGILSMQPTMLIGEADTGPPKVIEQLKRTALPVHILANVDTFDGIEKKIAIIASLLNSETQGEKVIQRVTEDKKLLEEKLSKVTSKPSVLFILSFRGGQAIVAGGDTSAHEMITVSGGRNITKHLKSWKPISSEALLELNPDVIIMMARHGTDSSVISTIPHFALLDAVKNKRLHKFDGGYLLGMNPRTPKAALELADLIHNPVTSSKDK